MHEWGVRGPNFHLVIGPIGDAAEMQERCSKDADLLFKTGIPFPLNWKSIRKSPKLLNYSWFLWSISRHHWYLLHISDVHVQVTSCHGTRIAIRMRDPCFIDSKSKSLADASRYGVYTYITLSY